MSIISGLVLRCCGLADASADAAGSGCDRNHRQFIVGPDQLQQKNLPQEQEAGALWHPSLRFCSVYEPQSAASAAGATVAASPPKSEQRQQQSCRACIGHQYQYQNQLTAANLYHHQQLMLQSASMSTGSDSLRRYRKRGESPMFNPYLRPRSCTSLEDIQVWSQRKTGALLMAAAAAAAAAAGTDEANAEADTAASVADPYGLATCSDTSSSNNSSGGSPPEIELSGYSDD